MRGRRNEPSYILETVDVIAKERGVSAETFADLTSRNAENLFQFEKHKTF